ncbi:hypothetical protein NADFUDRAFT_84445, partial [Nadsonia fulvescens var. elongata DSM 6958]
MPGDLNLKKSWHPGLMKNQVKVWAKEQEAIEERKKIAERQKEIQRESERNELLALQGHNATKPKVDRVEWMYAVPKTDASASGNDTLGPTDEDEAYLLGKKRIDSLLIKKDTDAVNALGGGGVERFLANTANTNSSASNIRDRPGVNEGSDLSAKLRHDPMMALEQKRQEMLQKTLSMRKASSSSDNSRKNPSSSILRKYSPRDQHPNRNDRHRERTQPRDGDRERNHSNDRDGGKRYRDDKEIKRSPRDYRERDRSYREDRESKRSYRDDRERDNSYRDDRKRDDSYRNDRRRDDSYRDDRKRDSCYHNSRERDNSYRQDRNSERSYRDDPDYGSNNCNDRYSGRSRRDDRDREKRHRFREEIKFSNQPRDHSNDRHHDKQHELNKENDQHGGDHKRTRISSASYDKEIQDNKLRYRDTETTTRPELTAEEKQRKLQEMREDAKKLESARNERVNESAQKDIKEKNKDDDAR